MMMKQNSVLSIDASHKRGHAISTAKIIILTDKEEKPVSRSLGIFRNDSKSSEAVLNNFKTKILDKIDSLSKVLNLPGCEQSMLELISATLTDHANDQKKFNNLLDSLKQSVSKDSGKIYQFFCNIHRLQIGSRDVATAILAFRSQISFEAQKSQQQQFDDFKADVYVFLKNTFFVCRDEGWSWGLKKCTAIRFFTFDRNAALVAKNGRIQELEKKLKEKKEKYTVNGKIFSARHEMTLKHVQDPFIRFVCWIIGIKYVKFDLPAMDLLARTGNIGWNREMGLKYLPRLLQVSSYPTEFFGGEFEVFPQRKNDPKFPIPEKPILPSKLDFNELELMKQVLKILYDALIRHNNMFSELTDAEMKTFRAVPNTSMEVEGSFGRVSSIWKDSPNASVQYVSSAIILRENKFTADSYLKLLNDIPNIKKQIKENTKKVKSQVAELKEIKVQQEQAEELEIQETLVKLVQKEEKEKKKAEEISKIKKLSRRRLLKHDYLLSDLKDQVKFHKLQGLSGKPKDKLLSALLNHIRDDETCSCSFDASPERTVSSHVKVAFIILDLEGDNARNFIDISAFNWVTRKWFNEDGALKRQNQFAEDISQIKHSFVHVADKHKSKNLKDYAKHGISYADTDLAPTVNVVWNKFLEYVRQQEANEIIICSHNGKSYDFSVLKSTLGKYQLEIPKSWILFDSLPFIKHLRGDRKGNKLDNLIEHFQLKVKNRHRAYDDVQALVQILERLLEKKTLDPLGFILSYIAEMGLDVEDPDQDTSDGLSDLEESD